MVGCLPFSVSTWAGGQALCGFRTCQTVGSGPLVVCSLLLSALSLCLWRVVLEYALFRVLRGFLEGFPCWMWVCIVRCFAWLVWLCTRVELGGFMTCCVFAPIFIVLQLFFFFFACFPALLVLFASLVYLCYLCGSLGV